MNVDSGAGGIKRNYREAFMPDELKHRFGSKEDLLTYFSEQRKSITVHLTLF